MSVQSEITRITGNIASAYTAVSGKGGTLPSAQNSANLPAAIESIPGQLVFSSFDGSVETEHCYFTYTLTGSTATFATTRIKGA